MWQKVVSVTILIGLLFFASQLIDEVGATETAFLFITYFIVIHLWRKASDQIYRSWPTS